METLAIIQARMGSTRLPGKVLATVAGKPLLSHMLTRVKAASTIHKTVVAIPNTSENAAIESVCAANGVDVFRGSEHDVLARYFHCAAKYLVANTIVRLTADCPLVDPHIIDELVTIHRQQQWDYVANNAPAATRKYPDGMDVEVFRRRVLARAYLESSNPYDREHVTPYMYAGGFAVFQHMLPVNLSKYRLTVDTKDDLARVQFLIQHFVQHQPLCSMYDILKFMEENNVAPA